MNSGNIFPALPPFSDEDLQNAHRTGKYEHIFFDWYKYVSTICLITANIQPDSSAFQSIPANQYYVLAGLLNRCARLMHSNICLSQEGCFGEATAILDRCIFESAIKAQWLSADKNGDRLTRYFADSLQPEIELRQIIQSNITNRDGETLPIESRMLKSIERHIDASGLTEEEILSTKKLQNLAAMLESMGYERLTYVVGQKIGSHHIHGTWSSLVLHYLEKAEEPLFNGIKFRPNSEYISTHVNQYMYISQVILRTLVEYTKATLRNPEASLMQDFFQHVENEMLAIYPQDDGGS